MMKPSYRRGRKEGRKEGRPRECESRRRKMLAGEAEQRKTRAKEEVGGGVAARSGVGCGTQLGVGGVGIERD